MARTGYHTRQRELIADFLKTHEGEHVRAADIAAHLAVSGSPVGVATVYRTLDMMTKSGEVKKYIDPDAGACYVFASQPCDSRHYHLKCSGCGKLIHLDCSMMSDLEVHIAREHSFELDPGRTVFYGTCAECGAKRKDNDK
jgi:Fur family ferric uptake transcriptional regulator